VRAKVEVPTVTIVTPSLNRADLLGRAIASVAAQRYQAIEHIVVDGGSTDGTLALLAECEARCGTRWISEPDAGMYNAINKGMSMATGEILAYLNTDDLYFPWTVEVAVETLLAHPSAGIVYGDIAHADTETGRGKLRLYAPFSLGYLVRSAFIGQPTAFWRRRVLEELNGFDERLRFVADCDFWMRAGKQFEMVKVDEILAVDGSHAGTLRATHRRQLFRELRSVRRANGAETGPRGIALRVADIAYHMVHTQLAFLRFVVDWGRSRMLGRRPRRWAHFLRSDTAISPWRLLLTLVPDPRRRIGWGVITIRIPELPEQSR
jgi:glycosyltransferase involved in cell wall biosynthesis